MSIAVEIHNVTKRIKDKTIIDKISLRFTGEKFLDFWDQTAPAKLRRSG